MYPVVVRPREDLPAVPQCHRQRPQMEGRLHRRLCHALLTPTAVDMTHPIMINNERQQQKLLLWFCPIWWEITHLFSAHQWSVLLCNLMYFSCKRNKFTSCYNYELLFNYYLLFVFCTLCVIISNMIVIISLSNYVGANTINYVWNCSWCVQWRNCDVAKFQR